MDLVVAWLEARGLDVVVLAAYYGALLPLAAYGLHRCWLCWSARRLEPRGGAVPEPLPFVTVQIPLYNERFVAARAIRAACALDYPRDRFEVQVLDDSDDDTAVVVAEAVAAEQARGIAVRHVRRPHREGYKAGALAFGQQTARGDLIAILDADFVAPSDFLVRATEPFADPAVGCVQARWGHLNRSMSLLTRIQALLLDGHFAIEQAGRAAAGCLFNFNGTAGVWRRRAIEDAGGWTHDTLTEDLDLSYRAQLAGWRFVFLQDLVVPAELPADLAAFKGQQDRWTRGSMQTARKLLGPVLKAPLQPRVRREAALHLLANLAYPLVVVLSVCAPLAMALRWGDPGWVILLVDLPLFVGGTAAVAWFYLESQVVAGRRRREALLLVPGLMALGIGMALHNSVAALGGLWRRGGEFRRTPKLALVDAGPRPSQRRAYRARLSGVVFAEVALAAWLGIATWLALSARMWPTLPFLALFLAGPLLVLALAARDALLRACGAATEA